MSVLFDVLSMLTRTEENIERCRSLLSNPEYFPHVRAVRPGTREERFVGIDLVVEGANGGVCYLQVQRNRLLARWARRKSEPAIYTLSVNSKTPAGAILAQLRALRFSFLSVK